MVPESRTERVGEITLIAIVPTFYIHHKKAFNCKSTKGGREEGWVRATHPSGPDPRSLTAV
jgi:hypothetical protein